MNISEQEIEDALRRAPQPKPPADLKSRLIAQVQLSAPHKTPQPAATVRPVGGWLRRWWPALAPATISLACAVALTVQQTEIRDLKDAIASLSQTAAAMESASSAPTGQAPGAASAPNSSDKWQEEIARLKGQAGQLAAEISQLEQLRAENANLRAELAKPAAALPPDLQADLDELAKAKERAKSIACVNNLKQLGLAFRQWAMVHQDRYPANVPLSEGGAMGSAGVDPGLVFLVISNELNTPRVLVCPADTNRMAPPNWASFTSANCSYQYVWASASETDPDAVLVTCPIHGNILLGDNRVHMGVAKDHPEWLVQRNGKLYYEPETQPPTTAPPP